MFLTAFALAAAIGPAPANIVAPGKVTQSAECNGALINTSSQSVFQRGRYPEAGLSARPWILAAHPEAGGYRTLDKMVGGCRVPVPVGQHGGISVVVPNSTPGLTPLPKRPDAPKE